MTRTRQLISAIVLSTGALLGTSGQAQAALTLPTANCTPGPNVNCLTFGDFTVYSLAYLQYLNNGDTNLTSGDAFYVNSSGQFINNALVVASSPAGRLNNQDLGLSGFVDNAYNTPNDIPKSPAENFLMAGTDPAPDGGTLDNRNQTTQVNPPNTYGNDGLVDPTKTATLPLWDIQISALKQFLGTNPLTFFFNLNESNQGGLDNGQDMYAWARVTLSDGAGHTMSFTLNGNTTSGFPNQSADQTTGVDNILPTADQKWAYVHGQICESKTQGLVYLDTCANAALAGVTVPSDAVTVNQNLGDQKAAFAIQSAALNAELANGTYAWDVMTVDLRMAHVDNGYEQLFILPTSKTENVPEPATLALLGLGLLGLGAFQRRTRQRA